jgi:hypothetical protein
MSDYPDDKPAFSEDEGKTDTKKPGKKNDVKNTKKTTDGKQQFNKSFYQNHYHAWIQFPRFSAQARTSSSYQ